MDIAKGYEEAIAALVKELHRKGYRSNYHLVIDNNNRAQTAGPLPFCLQEYIKSFLASYKRDDSFLLYTFSRYKNERDNIDCKLAVKLDEKQGFRIMSLEVGDGRTGIRHAYRFDSNRQLPPATALKSLFPRPKPWEFWKRKFRP